MGITLNVGEQAITLSATEPALTLSARAAVVTLSTCVPGPVGATGPVGPSSGAGYTLPTAIPIGGNRALATDNSFAVYADSSVISKSCVGISMGAVSAGDDVTLQSGGKMTVTGAGWTAGSPVYLSTNGTLTQVEPVTGMSQVLGVAHGSDVIIIEVQKPVILT